MKNIKIVYLFLLPLTLSFFACTKQQTTSAKKEQSIAIFVPGIVSGSPVYEMLVAGASKAVSEANTQGVTTSLHIVEAGTQQAEWGTKLTTLTADQAYSMIITSNPAMPDIIAPISERFPHQKFMIFDAHSEKNPAVTTFRYNQREQAYISGFMAALVSSSTMEFANPGYKIGLIAGQEYPAMTNIILKGYEEGAKAVDSRFEVDFRVVGNWYDAAKGADLARAMKAAGVDVIMPISGGANQGVLSAAKENGLYVAWFDDNGYAKAPGYVVSSAIMAQEKLVYEKVLAYIFGKQQDGRPTTVGISGRYIDFVSDDPVFLQTVPQNLRDRMNQRMISLYNGDIQLPVE